ncbi:MAG TPA: ABC transporter substrate-binding protein [Stellaceae bacterium]|jgi:peptide/nickel transport system substrate-binding protein|nr:ABC transporter substrate-binding protein [Stellaceae bacterium]
MRAAARSAVTAAVVSFFALVHGSAGNAADATPKRGGTLTYVIPADAPPSFDGHRESTFATIHAAAPFYSLLIRVDPMAPGSGEFVCDLCTEMPKPTDDGKTYTFKIRDGVKFHDGSPLTAADVAASWNEIIFPPAGVISPRQSYFLMVDKVEAPDPSTVVFHLKFATAAFLPALADPFAWIYEKKIIDKDPHWYEKNVMGSGPFKFVSYETGQSITGKRNPDYFRKGLPYLDGFVGIFADKQATRIDALRSDRAAIEFRGMPPTAVEEVKKALGNNVTVESSDWNVGSSFTINEKKKPFDDVRVRRALTLAIDRWHGAEALSKVAIVKTVGTFAFPQSPLAPTKAELQTIAGYWPDIDKSRAEAKRLLKEAGAENLSFELLNRNVDQPYKYVALWLIDDWSKIGIKVKQRVVPSGPWYEALRNGDFDVSVEAPGHGIVNPLLDVQKQLSASVSNENYGGYEDPQALDIYNRMLHEPDPAKQHALMFEFEKHNLDTEAHQPYVVWWYRTVPYHSYVKGWKIGPSHLANQDLATIWLDK